MGRAGRPQWQTRAGGPSGSRRGWDSAPIFGEEAHSRAGLLPLTLCSLRPRHHGDIIGKRLVLCLLLALHALFFLPPSRRPGGVGSRGESGTRPAPPPWGACRPQPPSQRTTPLPHQPWRPSLAPLTCVALLPHPFPPRLGALLPPLEPGSSLAPKSGNGGEQRELAGGVSASVCSLHTPWPPRDTDALQTAWVVPPMGEWKSVVGSRLVTLKVESGSPLSGLARAWPTPPPCLEPPEGKVPEGWWPPVCPDQTNFLLLENYKYSVLVFKRRHKTPLNT